MWRAASGSSGACRPTAGSVSSARLADHRAEAKPAAIQLRDLVEVLDTIEVDEQLRPCQAHVQHRNQALATGEQGRFIGCLIQQHHGVVEAARCAVVECGRLHGAACPASSDSPAINS